MKCEECLPLIEEYVDGELGGRMIERLDAHLSACAACAGELAELRREQELYANYRRDLEVTPAHWNIVRARIEQEKATAPRQEPRPGLLERLGGLFGKSLRPAFVAAVVLVAVTITAAVIYLNSRSRRTELAVQPARQGETPAGGAVKESSPPVKENENNGTVAGGGRPQEIKPVGTTQAVASNAPEKSRRRSGREAIELPRRKGNFLETALPIPGNARATAGSDARANNNGDPGADAQVRFEEARASVSAPEAAGEFDFEVARHAGRAELLLRSFRNVRPMTASARRLDVSFEKEQSRKLLYRNIALRRAADERGDPAALELLNTLEPILLDIANLPDRVRARDVASIERRMEKKEIVAALQVRTLLASN